MTLFQRTVLENLGIFDAASSDISEAEKIVELISLSDIASPSKKYAKAKDSIFFDELAQTHVNIQYMVEAVSLTESILVSGPTYKNISDIILLSENVEKNAYKENIEDILLITEILKIAQPINISVIEYFATRDTSESFDSSTVPELISISENVSVDSVLNLTVNDFFGISEVAAKAEFINLIDVWVITDVAQSSKWEEPSDRVYFNENLTYYLGESAEDNLNLSENANLVTVGVQLTSEHVSFYEAIAYHVT